ncbi:MAG: type II toxin-antitoxin system RelE family toxin [Candidatus Binatia bacterium]
MERSQKEAQPPGVVTYALSTLPRAEKALAKIQQDQRERIAKAIDALAKEPRPHGSTKLSGRDGYRIRVGQYRAVYEIDDEKKTVTILDVGHRREIYR